jgi:hypothetical protein
MMGYYSTNTETDKIVEDFRSKLNKDLTTDNLSASENVLKTA